MDWIEKKYSSDGNTITVLLLNEPMENALAGMVSSPLFRENIALVLNGREAVDYELACLGLMRDGSKARIYMIPDLLENLKNENEEAKLILFHEIGHYVNCDYLQAESQEKNDDERVAAVESGSVIKKELAADDFAASYIGKAAAIRGMQQLCKRIYDTYGGANEAAVALIIREIELRIAYQRSK